MLSAWPTLRESWLVGVSNSPPPPPPFPGRLGSFGWDLGRHQRCWKKFIALFAWDQWAGGLMGGQAPLPPGGGGTLLGPWVSPEIGAGWEPRFILPSSLPVAKQNPGTEAVFFSSGFRVLNPFCEEICTRNGRHKGVGGGALPCRVCAGLISKPNHPRPHTIQNFSVPPTWRRRCSTFLSFPLFYRFHAHQSHCRGLGCCESQNLWHMFTRLRGRGYLPNGTATGVPGKAPA